MRRIITIFFSSLVVFVFSLTFPQTLFASQSNLTSGCNSLTASPDRGAVPLAVNFSGEGFDQGHSITMYEFDFGDASGGQPRVIRQVSSAASHRYYNPGTYTTGLKVQTSKGQFVGGGDCKKTIVVTQSVLGAKSINTLPKTGVKDYLGIALVGLVILGIYLRKHFQLS